MLGQLGAVLSKERRTAWWWLPENGIARTAFEIGLILPCYVLYKFVRGTVNDRTEEAYHHARALISVEQTLGIFREADLQSLILPWSEAVRMANFVYVWGHLPLIIVVAIWLFAFHRQRYTMFRNAFLISGGIGLLFFWQLPMAPPRFIQYWGFVDTTVREGSYYFFQPPALTNQYAAMPSLHVGWSLLGALALFTTLRGRWRYLAFLLPVSSFGGVVLTANHYFLDAVVGCTIAVTALWLAMQLHRLAPRQKPFSILT